MGRCAGHRYSTRHRAKLEQRPRHSHPKRARPAESDAPNSQVQTETLSRQVLRHKRHHPALCCRGSSRRGMVAFAIPATPSLTRFAQRPLFSLGGYRRGQPVLRGDRVSL
ncbi:hypothetical protein SKAU_G00184860 [Synaphobranchus kaupii]|uniref:Uncharacterized protein n=1 Tax=Synaphobranchus kaupii TaxID=118154 RepID=A0A9Q1FCG5_SYNKA|nr:hypothetical protein SKAU_G00184860 [Synaphobranchus kaupii]